jgi:polyferredoxin
MIWDIVGDLLRLTVLVGLGVAGLLTILIWKKNLSTKVTYLRFVIQAVAFAAIFYLFSYTIPMLFVLIAIFAMSIFLGRFFCGWLCPFALIMDLVSALRKVTKKRYRILPDRLNLVLHKLRYVVLFCFLITPLVLWLLDPREIMVSPMMLEVLAGHYRLYGVLLDPTITVIVPWSSAPLVINDMHFSYPYVQNIIFYVGENFGQIIAVTFVGLTVVGSFFVRRFWCRFCPTGCSVAAANRFKGFKWMPGLYIAKEQSKCTKCGVCKRVCPVQVKEVYEQKSGKIMTSMCIQCYRCVEMCPYEEALKVKLGKKTVFQSRNWLNYQQGHPINKEIHQGYRESVST